MSAEDCPSPCGLEQSGGCSHPAGSASFHLSALPAAFIAFVCEVVQVPRGELTMDRLIDFDDEDGRLDYMLRARGDEYQAYKLPHPASNSALRKLSDALRRYRAARGEGSR